MSFTEGMLHIGQDSAGRFITLGDRVKFRGQIYTIQAFKPGEGRGGCQGLVLDREPHVSEPPDEISVDVVR